ncbi:hypothetical protein [Bradyrhizobium shewense]|uniref:hypothetical protein n=1 Tax=Bradyrhizobium shewense TaxID=1761772 RepID=UPI0013F62B93|nr:hypothetical protein [Bradyrhizobium shewense]
MADIITTIANAVAIAAATLRTRSSPIVCRVPEGCDLQHMTTNPEANGGAQKCNTTRSRMRRFVLNCHVASIGCSAETGAIALDCGSAATGRKLQNGTIRPPLKFTRGLLTGDFHVAMLDTIGIGRSAVRFATLRFKTRTDSRKPVCGVAREKRPRLFYI